MTTENVGNYPLPWVELPVRITDRLHTDVGSTVKQVLAFLQVPQGRRGYIRTSQAHATTQQTHTVEGLLEFHVICYNGHLCL